MYIPIWALIALVLITGANLMLDLAAYQLKRRHHDHLRPSTPRAPRD